MLAPLNLFYLFNWGFEQKSVREKEAMEAAPGIEPGENDFAGRCLNHLAMPPR